jgi:hypothetical protein
MIAGMRHRVLMMMIATAALLARGAPAPVAAIATYVVIWLGENARICTGHAHREWVAPDKVSPYTKPSPISWDQMSG